MNSAANRGLLIRLLYRARDLRGGALYHAIQQYCRGDVLDVGGADFFLRARRFKPAFTSWTVLDVERQAPPPKDGVTATHIVGDGCNMAFGDHTFDCVLNIQVLEHVFQPIRMVEEMTRVLKPGGTLMILLPVTSTLHMAPRHYYNFTRYWCQETMRHCGLTILQLQPLGGAWSSIASRLLYLILQSLRTEGMSTPEIKRRWPFYVLWPFMMLFAVVAIPVCLIFGVGDLKEEPNNYLVVARKPA